MDNEEGNLGFLVSDAARLLRTVFDRRVHKLKLTRAQWLVVTRLHRWPGASQSELADMIEIEKASAGRLVDRLESKGWVTRRPDPVDRRINRLYLTPEAEKVQQKIAGIAQRTVDDAFHDLTTAECDQLTDLLAIVKARLAVLALNGESSTKGTRVRRAGTPSGATAPMTPLAQSAGDGSRKRARAKTKTETDRRKVAGRKTSVGTAEAPEEPAERMTP